jgi:hypothetical protein
MFRSLFRLGVERAVVTVTFVLVIAGVDDLSCAIEFWTWLLEDATGNSFGGFLEVVRVGITAAA